MSCASLLCGFESSAKLLLCRTAPERFVCWLGERGMVEGVGVLWLTIPQRGRKGVESVVVCSCSGTDNNWW